MRAPHRFLQTRLWHLTECRRYLAGLETLALGLRADAERLREIAATSGDAAARQAALSQCAVVERSIAEVEVQIAAARHAVAEATLAVKHHEAAARIRGAPAVRRPHRR